MPITPAAKNAKEREEDTYDVTGRDFDSGFPFSGKRSRLVCGRVCKHSKKVWNPQLIIGLTIVAMGTSMPEAAVSITAAMQQNAGITIGNVVGSNILNIFIILGLTALITNVAIQRSTLFYEIPFMMFVTVVLMICGITGGKVTFAEGIVLWVLFLVYLGYLFVMSKKGENPEAPSQLETYVDGSLRITLIASDGSCFLSRPPTSRWRTSEPPRDTAGHEERCGPRLPRLPDAGL